MRAIIHWRLLPDPLFTILFWVQSQILCSVFRVPRPRVVLLQRQRPREVVEKSDSPLLFSHSEDIQDSAVERFCCGRSFLKAVMGGGGDRTRSEQPLLSQGGVFQRSQCPFTHQFALISTLHSCLCTRTFAQKPHHKSATDWIQHQEKSKSRFSYERSGNNNCGTSFIRRTSLSC